MRISRLDLKRYGKFTDKSVVLPVARHDFHLIVGPNEAGKSTLRNAIQDLLFGIETRSRYNFIHPHNEMCLGAQIEQGGEALDFIRTKARTKTLQNAAGAPLPDNALLPYLGQVDRAFFDQMFGLNHDRLVKGGQEILSASNDIGQILFQAAAGIGSLGEVRDKLEKEAESLWAKRRSGEREYYKASDELEQAESTLKQVTVRTKDWQEARTSADGIAEELQRAKEHYRALEQERNQLERLRRIAPILAELAEHERQQAGLGQVVPLPEDAKGTLADSENEIANATQLLQIHKIQASQLLTQIDALHPDEAVLSRAEDIDALAELRSQLRNHEGDILKREEEIKVHWQATQSLLRQLGWADEDEAALTQRLPGALTRTAIDTLLRRKEALDHALTAAEDALRTREAEIKAVDAEIAGLSLVETPVSLLDALDTARSLGDVVMQCEQNEALVERSQRQLADALARLGDPNPALDDLRKLQLPTQDEVNALIKQREVLNNAISKAKERLDEVELEAQGLELEISQYKTAHQPVTFGDVQQIRRARDSIWENIKTGKLSLNNSAPDYERSVIESDALSDRRHDKAQEETELQSRQDRLQRLLQQKTEYAARLDDSRNALVDFDFDWGTRINASGLLEMPLLRVNDWRSNRELALFAADKLADAHSSRQAFELKVKQATSGLIDALATIRTDANKLSFTALVLQAKTLVETSTRNQERRNALASQKSRADILIPDLRGRMAQAEMAIESWRTELEKNLKAANLPVDADVGFIEGALELFESMDQHLQKIRDLRTNRIDMMRRDLDEFALSARALAEAIAPSIAKATPTQISIDLSGLLKREQATAEELVRLKVTLRSVTSQLDQANEQISVAMARLEPLFRIAGTTDNNELRVAIESSDRHRLLQEEIDLALKQLLQAGDGMDREALESELNAVDIAATAGRLPEIALQIEEVVAQQIRLSADLNAAEAALGKIAGQDAAARAESLRQEALAKMANAAERYIKVFTAAKLLRWSIERFREDKQGPMLMRASEIFSGLTRGAFDRLTVDYESEPLKLSGLRAGGGLCVEVEGMSEGTRDQLYLALRLAALELHLGQAIALPFVADDLFINYDDDRALAGIKALANLSEKTQVIFLSHHTHLVDIAKSALGAQLNVINLLA